MEFFIIVQLAGDTKSKMVADYEANNTRGWDRNTLR